jgi:hypothetical protein
MLSLLDIPRSHLTLVPANTLANLSAVCGFDLCNNE